MATAERTIGFQQIAPTVSTALTVPNGARWAYLSAEVQDIRMRSDGIAPTTAIGLLIKVGQQPVRYDGDLSQVRVINAVAGGILNVEYH